MVVTHKYRLYPTAKQRTLLAQHFGCVRWVYNHALALKTEAWKERKESLSRKDLSAMLPVLKKTPGTEWLSDVTAQSLQASLRHLDAAYTKFFRDKKGYPKFKSKHGRQSCEFPQKNSVGENFVSVSKVGKIAAAIDRLPEGRVKTVTISRTPTGKHFAAVTIETNWELPELPPVTESRTVGIDLGLKHYAVLSTGERIENPRPLKNKLRRLRRAQRRMSKRIKGSNRRNKQRRRTAIIHEKVTNTRQDFLHKLTTRLVRDNKTDSFAIENLGVQGMIHNHRLAFHIQDAAWGEFRRQLEYKAERAGKNVLVIGRFEPSSKACPCGLINASLKLSERIWTCACGATHDRDLNAALNIKRFALHPQNFVRRDTPEFTHGETHGSRRAVNLL